MESWIAFTGRDFNGITLELTRVVIALSVFAVGVELPKYHPPCTTFYTSY